MKASKIIKSVAMGVIATAAISVATPQYTTIAAAGSGIYILYSLITSKDNTAKAMGVTFDKERNKIIAVIRNPGKKPITIKSQVRLKDIPKTPDGSVPMMRAAAEREATTLIGESKPITIPPGATIRVEYDLLIPKEMLDASNGIIQVMIEPSKETPKKDENPTQANMLTTIPKLTAEIKSVDTETKSKIDASLDNIETIIKQSQPYVNMEQSVPAVEHTSVQNEFIETIEPEQQIQIIDCVPEETITDSDISVFMETGLNNVNVTYESLEEDFIPAPRPMEYEKGKGRGIGVSTTMLEIIRKMDEIKRINLKYIENKDAI